MCRSCSPGLKKGLVFGIGSFLMLVGFVIGGVWTIIYDKLLQDNLMLQKGTPNYDMWVETPIPMYLDVYFFNWTNAEEFLHNTSVKPIFEEIGPYVFSEHHKRVNIVWNGNGTVTFNQVKVWHFEQELSKGLSLTDKITGLNAVTATTAFATRYMKKFLRLFLNQIMELVEEKMIVTEEVGDLLFNGYEDKFLNIVKKYNSTAVDIPFDRFGYFVNRNESATYDGVFNMYTGTDYLRKVGIMAEWNYKSETEYYDYPCNMINGTTGELWPPTKEKEDVEIFSPDVCGSLKLRYNGSASHLGLEGNYYIGDDLTLDNGAIYPEQACYNRGERLRSGAFNASSCRFGAPVFLSYPHFYLADSSYLDAVEGLKPDKDHHQFHIAVDPVTGAPMFVNVRMQINLYIQPIDGYTMYEGMPKILIPVLWFDQRAKLSEELSNFAKLVTKLPAIGMGVFFGIGGIGMLIVFIGIMITIKKGWDRSDREILIAQ